MTSALNARRASRSLSRRLQRWRRRPTVVEAIRVIFGGLLLSVIVNWPVATRLASHVPQERSDPFMMAWRIAWPWHAATSSDTLWNSNTFYPEPDSYAFTDTLLGYAPLGIFVNGPADAIVRYNLAFLLAGALAFIGCYALARQLGAAWPAAVLAGIIFAMAPWTLAHGNHLNILSTGGIALTFFALARGFGFSFRAGYRREKVKIGWLIAGWGFACWQITIGFAIGLAFVYVLAIVTIFAIAGWLLSGRPHIPRKALIVTALGWGTFLIVTYLMAQPMLRVSQRYDAERSVEEIGAWSAPWQGLFTAPPQSWAWGDNHIHARLSFYNAAEQTLLPGYVALALGLFGLFYSAWRLWVRVSLLISAVVTGILAIGTSFFDGEYSYLFLYDYAPGFNGIRVPGRLIVWPTICLALLAAGAITKAIHRFHEMAANFGGKALRTVTAVALIPALLAFGEGFPERPYPSVPRPPAPVQRVLADSKPVLFLPMDPWDDSTFMLWSTDGYAPIANGITGFFPPAYWELTNITVQFPNRASVQQLRDIGIRTVVVLPDHIENTEYANALNRSIVGLGIRREVHDEAVIFYL